MARLQLPEGKHISTVKVGEKGQTVIPKGIRELFDIKPGDTLHRPDPGRGEDQPTTV